MPARRKALYVGKGTLKEKYKAYTQKGNDAGKRRKELMTHQEERRHEKRHNTYQTGRDVSFHKVEKILEPFSEWTFGDQPGVVLTCGQNEAGQLGVDQKYDERKRLTKVALPGDRLAVAAVAGGMQTVCITQDGRVATFGCNDYEELGRPTNEEEDNFEAGLVEGVLTGGSAEKEAVQVAAGDGFSACLTRARQVYVWGVFRKNSGMIGLLRSAEPCSLPTHVHMPDGEKVVKIAAGKNHLVLLTSTGLVFTLGSPDEGCLGRLPARFSTRSDGDNRRNRSSRMPGLLPVPRCYPRGRLYAVNIWASMQGTFVKRSDGQVFACGVNSEGQLGYRRPGAPADTTDIFAEDPYRIEYMPVPVPALTDLDVVQITGGESHTVILARDGRVYTCGTGTYGRLGQGAARGGVGPTGFVFSPRPQPVAATLVGRVAFVGASSDCSYAVTEAGKAYAWGPGSTNMLSQMEDDDQWEPVPMLGKNLEGRRVHSICGGGVHTVVLAGN